MEKKEKWLIGCGIAAVVALMLGVMLAGGGYFLWKTLQDTETETDEETPVAEAEASLSQLLAQAEWQNMDDGFRYPTFMRRSENFIADIPASVKTYGWKEVELCYWPLIGAWAVDDNSFPVRNCYVTATNQVETVTYKATGKGVFSGHTADGRIFYLKKRISEGDAVRHVSVLAIIYPEQYQNDVQPFIDMVQNW